MRSQPGRFEYVDDNPAPVWVPYAFWERVPWWNILNTGTALAALIVALVALVQNG